MTTANIAFNPMQTTVASGSFNTTSAGYMQGTALNDPNVRNQLAGGILASAETLPMWGGVGVFENISGTAGQPLPNLGGQIGRATTLLATSASGLAGFSVFDQDSSMITTPQSPVPQAGSGMGVNFYRLGSLARIVVACDPILVNLYGSAISSLVSWDFVNQRLIPYSPTYAANTITGAVWASTSGGQTTYTVSSDPTSYYTAGDDINITGVVSTGATTDGYNGAFVVVSTTSTTIVVTAVRAASPGTYSSGGSVIAGGGALACKVLDFNVGNSMTVSYDSTTGFATWNRSGSAAVILI